jgi:O-antigen/teichoic acid export membrane protein
MVVASAREKSLLARGAALVRQPLFANAGYLLAVNMVGALVGFVFWGLAARIYQPEEVGTASATLSVMALLSGIASLGMGNSLVRFLPGARSPERFLNTVFTFNTLIALPIAGVYLAGLSIWSPSLIALRQNGLYIVGFLTYIIAATVAAVVQMAFVARRRADYTLIHTCVIQGGRLLLVVVLTGLGAMGLVGSMALAVVLATVFSLTILLPRVVPGYRLRPDIVWHDLTTIIPYSLGNYIANLLIQLPQMILPLIILEVLGSAFSGYAYIAWMLGYLLTSPGMALASSAFAEGSNAPHKLTTILIRAAALALLLTLPAVAILGITAPWVLLLFGSSYAQEASGLLRWLAVAAPLVVLTGLYFTYLRVQKRIGWLIVLSTVVAAATLGVTVVLMPSFGIAAGGIGWLIGNGLVAILTVWQMMRGRAEVMSTKNLCPEE